MIEPPVSDPQRTSLGPVPSAEYLFSDFIDMLRHETPLYLMENDVLGTSQSEPVGEGE